MYLLWKEGYRKSATPYTSLKQEEDPAPSRCKTVSLQQWKCKVENPFPSEAVKVWSWGLLRETIHPQELPE